MTTFYNVLTTINNVLLIFISIAFIYQILYILLCWLPYKNFKKSKKKYRFAVIICARNEELVIKDTIKCIQKQNYPADKFDIFVFAHNCTDATAKKARQAGAKVYEINDNDPAHARAAYALKGGIEQLLKEYPDSYDAFIRFDADNVVHPDYISKMNDAYAAGYQMARGKNASKNLTQNVYTGISGLWYLRDNRFSAHTRKAFKINQLLAGSGMMFSSNIIKADGGWTALGLIEDNEFGVKHLYKGYKSTYVRDAIVYDDQPSTLKDTFNRLVRLGKGSWNLFWSDGLKCLGKFFCTLNLSYLDVFFTLLFIPIAVVCCTWIPFYYVYDFSWTLAIGDMAHMQVFLKFLLIALIFFFIVPFILQAILIIVLERKTIGKENIKKLWKPVLAFPFFMIIYAIAIFVGAVSKPKWKAITRNETQYVDVVIQEQEEKE
ncbi:MAG: glycosyltransferase family 2 protein [Clostridia bacterium]|nr:glycosyltransferase family 2 protein [Clostridia bacterium]